MTEQIVQIDDKLSKLGYRESKNKRGLYYKSRQHGIVYLDHRDVGGKSVEEQINEGPLCYSYPQDRTADRESAWQNNRAFMMEQTRLVSNGIKFRVSIVSNIPLVGEIEYQNGFCKVCDKNFKLMGLFCSKECRDVFDQEIEYEKGICTICNDAFPEHILWSDECKNAFGGLKFESEFCKVCHKVFLFGLFCSDACEKVFNINNSARKQGNPIRQFMKFLGMA